MRCECANINSTPGAKFGHNGEKNDIERRKNIVSNMRSTAPKRTSTKSRVLAVSLKNGLEGEWGDNFEPESPPPMPTINLGNSYFSSSITRKEKRERDARNFNLKKSKVTTRPRLHKESNMSEGSLQTLKDMKSTSVNSSTSTLFHDPQHDITILLTSPEDVIFESAHPRNRRSSISSLPSMSLHQSKFNTSLLMPPTDRQRDPQKQHQAEEIKEVRKWLITFINAKGDTFPRKIRQKMMDEYRICDWDLDPEAVAKFNAEECDEGVSIRNFDERDQKESLQILSQAFRSQIEEVRPQRVIDNTPHSTSGTRNRRNSRPVTPRATSMLVTIPDDEELPPTWLGPLISSTMYSKDSVLAGSPYRNKSFSTSDLHAASPRPTHARLNSADSMSAIVGGVFLKRDTAPGRKSGGLRGVFGSFVETLGGRSSGVRALKKSSRLGTGIDSHG